MPGTRTQNKDVIARIADSGEDALRKLVDLPRRIVVEAVDEVDERLHDLATKVREIDPLYGRLGALEKRVEALEKAQRPRTRRSSTRSKTGTTRSASGPPAPAPEQAGEPGRSDDAAARGGPGGSRPMGERAP
jgi:hypothetical protein